MKAIGYVRVSTEEQAKEGLSLENQKEKIKAFCFAKDWELLEVYEEKGKSAADLNREGMKRSIEGCQRHLFDVVVVYKLDRLTRSVRDLGYLTQDVFEENGIAFSSIMDNFDTATANGKLVLNILGALAQWERDIISERTKDALAYKKEKGEYLGTVPLGFYLNSGELIKIEDELETVRYIKDLYSMGISYRGIARRLNNEERPTKRGGHWHDSTVRYLLKNQLYSTL